MAERGFADGAEFPPNTSHSAEIGAAVADARADGRGLWSACGSADVPLRSQDQPSGAGPPPGVAEAGAG